MGKRWVRSALRVLMTAQAGLFLFAACDTTQRKPLPAQQAAPAENVLKVGVSPNTPPVIFKQGLETAGLEADLAREFAAYLGRQIRFIEVPWNELVQQLLDKRIDIIMSGMSVTRGRLFQLSFSNPYYSTGLQALFRIEDRRRFAEGWEDSHFEEMYLNVGVEKGTTAETWVRETLPDVRLVTYIDPRKCVSDLVYGYLDIFVHDEPVISLLAAENEAKGLIASRIYLKQYDYAWGLRKDNMELLISANAFLEDIRKSGRLQNLIRQWIPK
jgi:ABC-type amino acid transport substrate-binding protein